MLAGGATKNPTEFKFCRVFLLFNIFVTVQRSPK